MDGQSWGSYLGNTTPGISLSSVVLSLGVGSMSAQIQVSSLFMSCSVMCWDFISATCLPVLAEVIPQCISCSSGSYSVSILHSYVCHTIKAKGVMNLRKRKEGVAHWRRWRDQRKGGNDVITVITFQLQKKENTLIKKNQHSEKLVPERIVWFQPLYTSNAATHSFIIILT